ncbi:ATP-binding cassette sub-family A member 2-like [Physella acuta]|uniref:ATP-binding cassette sub-family A member 2-like n=1 Tax=Physella acuta TaxID=109671 RepID=UPI0027DACAF9|nr:ATP-binding cassette sub-family A member 2-like [Physella acuta]
MPDAVELRSQFSALMYKNAKLIQRSKAMILLEIAVSIFTISLFVMFNISTPDVEFSARRNVLNPLARKNTIAFMPDTAGFRTLLQEGNDRQTHPQHLLGISHLHDFKEQLGFGEASSSKRSSEFHAVIFDPTQGAVDAVPRQLKFRVVVNDAVPTTQVSGDNYDYTNTSLTTAQLTVTQMFLTYWKRQNPTLTFNPNIAISTQLMPQQETGHHMKLDSLEMMSKYMPCIYIWLTLFTTLLVVEEKVSRIKETLKILGVGQFVYWTSWFLARLLVGTIISLIASFVWTVNFGHGPLFNMNQMFLFIWLVVMAIDNVTFAFVLSSLLNDARFTAVYTIFSYGILNYMASLYVVGNNSYLFYILGPTMFSFGINLCTLSLYGKEYAMNSWDKGHRTSTYNTKFMEGTAYMVLNSFFNCLLLWIIEKIINSEQTKFENLSPRKNERKQTIAGFSKQDETYFEQPAGNEDAGVAIYDLVKMYGNEVAVAGITLEFYKDQITIILGHNGAGKTSTITTILGLTPLTCGRAEIDGNDVTSNISDLRRTLGYCPQREMLFPRMTCMEHLVFYCKIRNQEIKYDEINELLSQLGIQDKAQVNPSKLSGGQRRKLAVAIAFVGNTTTIFLDEPSTGLDPSARRDLWRFLKNRRSGRTIVMTTHFMDEADILSDRIAILAGGVVECCGTSAYLKKIFGIGYKLTFIKGPKCKEYNVIKHLMEYIPSAIYQSSTRTEINFRLPDQTLSDLPKLLKSLDSSLATLNVESYGLFATSIEDVFFRVGERFEIKKRSKAESMGHILQTEMDQEPVEVEKKESGKNSKANTELSSEKPKTGSTVEVGSSKVDNIPQTQPRNDMVSRRSSETIKSLKKDGAESVMGSVQDEVLETKAAPVDQKNVGIRLHTQQVKALVIKRWIMLRRNTSTILFVTLIHATLTLMYVIKSHDIATTHPLDFNIRDIPGTLAAVLEPTDPDLRGVSNRLRALLQERMQVFTVTDLPNGFNAYFIDWAERNSVQTYRRQLLLGFEIRKAPEPCVVYYQSDFVHLEAIGVQMLLNAHVREYLGNDFQVQTGVYPYGHIKLQSYNQGISLLLLHFAVISFETLILSWLVSEKSTGAHTLTLLSGVPSYMYWGSMYLFDIALFLFYIATQWACILGQQSLENIKEHVHLLIPIHFLFILDVLPFIYIFSKLFVKPTLAVFIFVSYAFLHMLAHFTASYYVNEKLLIYVNHAFLMTSPNTILNAAHTRILLFDSDAGQITTTAVFAFVIHWFICWFFLIVVESLLHRGKRCTSAGSLHDFIIQKLEKSLTKITNLEPLTDCDDEVIAERQRVQGLDLKKIPEQDEVLMVNLCKKYLSNTHTLTAVENTNLGIAKNECFGLLGGNGAGKSSTFKMLIGEIPCTSGNVFYRGLNLETNRAKLYRMIGYCPQHDFFQGDLTGREVLYFYGRLRGIKEHKLKQTTDFLIKAAVLDKYADKQTKIYSGGTKRKLSVAVCVIGDPQFVLLDEPTTGMDIIAKRAIWAILQDVRSMGSTLIFTSQSMEECELLCSKLTIMIHGRLMCLGTPQYLKTKYAQGYTITVHVKVDSGVSLEDVVAYINKIFDHCEIFCKMETYLHMQIPAGVVRLSNMFNIMETAKKVLRFESYTIQQTNLEQVFLMLMNRNTGEDKTGHNVYSIE